MLEFVPIERQLRITFVVICLAFVVSIFYGWQVWDIYERNAELGARTNMVEDADLEIVNRKMELQALSKELQQVQNLGKVFRSHGELMEYVEDVCDEKGVKLLVLPREEVVVVGGCQISKVSLEAEGSFEGLLSLLYQFEQVDKVGSVASVTLARKEVRTETGSVEVLTSKVELSRMIEAGARF